LHADGEIDFLQERFVQSTSAARGRDREASMVLESLQEIVDLELGVTVVAILDLGAFAKKRVRFVEKRIAPISSAI